MKNSMIWLIGAVALAVFALVGLGDNEPAASVPPSNDFSAAASAALEDINAGIASDDVEVIEDEETQDYGLLSSPPESEEAVPSSVAQNNPPRRATRSRAGVDYDCDDFSSHAEAQEFFEANGGPENDPHKLDRDRDGLACESL